jgi:uncharacterized protein (DUF1697 family)
VAVFIVLLRGIGAGTHKIMSMAQWRQAAARAGFKDPQTYVATGNMIVEGDGSSSDVAAQMNQIVLSLGLSERNGAVVRTPEQLQAIVDANPLPEAAASRPSQMGVYFFASETPDLEWTQSYEGPETMRIVQQHLIIDYNGRISDSKLLGGVEKRSGFTTARNWNTLKALVERSVLRSQ